MRTLTMSLIVLGALATSAGVMTLYAATRRTYRGFAWWVVAQWLLAQGERFEYHWDQHGGLL